MSFFMGALDLKAGARRAAMNGSLSWQHREVVTEGADQGCNSLK
jgi:hypothetical protein